MSTAAQRNARYRERIRRGLVQPQPRAPQPVKPPPTVADQLTRLGFAATYVGPSTYQLNAAGWQPICPRCPRQPPGDRLTIPVVEVHAERCP